MFNFFLSLLLTCLLRGIGLFYSLCIFVIMSIDTMRFGTRVWSKKNRRKKSPPSVYTSWTPPAQSSASAITWKHCYLQAGGLRFHYVATGQTPPHLKINDIDGETIATEQISSDRPKLLLCVHGFPESWFSWRYVLKDFQDNPSVKENNGDVTSYFVVAMDMRGYGGSDHPHGIAAYHRSKLAADIKAITQGLGYEKCTILAHDWGGVVAWHVAEYLPELIDRMIVLNCPHPKAGVSFALQNPFQLLVKSSYMYVFMIPKIAELYISFNDFQFIDLVMTSKMAGIQSQEHALDKDELDLVKYTLEGRTLTSAINYYRALLLPFYQPKEKCSPKLETRDAKFPILLLWGGRDAFMDSRMAEMTKPLLPSSDPPSRVEIIEGGSHWLQQDRPNEVIERVREFLSQ